MIVVCDDCYRKYQNGERVIIAEAGTGCESCGNPFSIAKPWHVLDDGERIINAIQRKMDFVIRDGVPMTQELAGLSEKR